MNVLVIGSGGREHALAWKIKQSPKCGQLYVAPGNAGTALVAENVALDIEDHQAIIDFAMEKQVDLVVVGPDDSLAGGIVDALQAVGIPAFGPTKSAAKIEWSKAFAMDFMKRHHIPTAKSETFSSFDEALKRATEMELPVVIKADGLALGKGVVIAETREEIEDTLRAFMVDELFGDSGKTIILEEFLRGSEISIHAFCDGKTAKIFPVSRDHKRIWDGNTGLNTGGMGTIAPVQVSSGFLEEIQEKVLMPALEGMAAEKIPFVGILYPGLMVTKTGIRVLEFNARFGDPEAQSYMRLLDSDILDIMLACTQGRLADTEVRWSNEAACTVVLASGGYPEEYKSGYPITGLDSVVDESVVVFQAGTKQDGEDTLTAGGRVLGISATGATGDEAVRKAYAAAEKIHFQGVQYRKDIGSFWGM